MKKILLIFFIFIFLPFLTLAEGELERGISNAVYTFHLYYDNGRLLANRDFKFAYDIIPEKFIPEVGPYEGEVVNFSNQTVATFKFDPQKGNPDFKKGAVEVKGPYAPDAAKIDFYDNQRQKTFTLSVASSAICNNDSLCDAGAGETSLNCPSDCQVAPSVSPEINFPPVERDFFGFFSNPTFYIILGIIILVAVLVWMLIKRKRNIPPEIPPQL